MPEVEQLSMFSMPAAQEPVAGSFELGKQIISQRVIDAVLASGTNDPRDTLRIAARFMHDNLPLENADFLRDLYGTDGKGLVIDGRKVSMWTDEAGLRIAFGNTAQISGGTFLSWPGVAERIRELLDAGEYITQAELDFAPANELQELSDRLLLAYRDSRWDYPEIWGEVSRAFDEASENLSAMLTKPETRAEILTRFRDDIRQHREQFSRRTSERLLKLEDALSRLDRPSLEFHSSKESETLERFITQDEIDAVLGTNVKEEADSRISRFFQQRHTPQEQEQFLRQEYGIGGRLSSTIEVNYDRKGLRILHGNSLEPDAQILLNWRQVAQRYTTLIQEGKYGRIEQPLSAPENPSAQRAGSENAEPPSQGEAGSFENLQYEPADDGLLAKDDTGSTLALIHNSGTVSYLNPYLTVDVIDRINKQAEIYWQSIENPREESDDFSDIDTAAIREQLERGDSSAVDEMLEAAQKVAEQYDEPPYERFKVIEAEGGFAVWDDIRDEIYVDADGTTRTFPTEEQADAYRQQVKSAVEEQESREWQYMERARDGVEEPKQDYSYAVGDTVYYDGTTFEIERISPYHVHMRDLNAVYPISRVETRQNFEAMLWSDYRNAQYLPSDAQTVVTVPNLEITVSSEDAAALEPQLEQAGIRTTKFVHSSGVVTFGFDASYKEAVEELAQHLDKAAASRVEPDTAPKPESSKGTATLYSGEKTGLPFDVVIERMSFEEPVRAPDAEHEPEPEPATVAEPAVNAPAVNFRITDDHLGEGGIRTKADRNIEAIRTLVKIESEGRSATPEEQETLSQYVGWGGIPQIFDEGNAEWDERRASLKELLTEEEYKSARGSTLNAHYTSPVVIHAMYQALENMGFQTGNILEPSCGIGNFIGAMPDALTSSRVYGVELDSVTGRIARQLYPESKIRVQGFETADFPDNFFDVAVGNVPFGAYKLPDRRYDRHNLRIHDYFFYKTLDKVRAGGVIAFVTSKGTFDKQDSTVRKYLAERADLLGAIRLPNNAFLKNANTEVTTDIIFLQKRDEPNLTVPSWVNVGQTEDGVPVNQYFLDHPEMMLGMMRFDKSMYGNEQDTTCDPIPGADLAAQLSEAVQNIQGEYRQMDAGELVEDEEIIPADVSVPDYSFARVEGQLYFRENSIMRRIHVSAKAEQRICAMIELRDLTRDLLNAQLENYPDEFISALQRKLNDTYDAFVKDYGRLSDRANAQAFSEDDGYYLLTSLEVLDDQRNFQGKADIFTKRTIRPAQIPDRVDTAQEALVLSISEQGRVDFEYMTALTGKSADDLISDLQGQIFQDPVGTPGPYEHWQTADEYLSGNVREKLKAARAAAEMVSPRYEVNVKALEEVQPKDLEPHEIDVRLGSTWIPASDIQEFVYDLLQPSYYQRYKIKVNYCPKTASWNITNKSLDQGVLTMMQYGTKRVNAYKLIEESLNLRDVRVFDTVEDADGNPKRVLNQKETILAQQKQTAIREAFRDWIWKDPRRCERLCRLYNDRFNNLRLRQFDGSYLSFNGLNPEMTLRPHQKDAVARILFGGNTLLAHVVGAGKTAVMVSGIMEKKRLGLARKALVAVPNHLTQQTAAEFLRFYPAAKVLVATKKDFEKANRKKFIGKIATGNYDAIIMGHSQFEKVPMSKQRQAMMLQEQIEEVMQGIEEVKQSRGERFTVKELERTRKTLETRLKKLNSDEDKDAVINFEQLGIDMLVVDEAHNYKNCAIVTKMRNVAGIQTTEAKKSSDMLMKCRYISEITNNSGVVFATGTPISNSMVEMYNMQRYLQNDMLKEKGLAHFDQWASTFGETQTAIELAPEGTGYRSKTRFSRFFNLPELIGMFRMVADVQTADMLKLPVPALKGGQIQNIRSDASEFQKDVVKMLGERAEKVRSGGVDPRKDNMLKITNDGRLLALDARLIDPMQPDDPNSKVNTSLKNVLRIYEEGAEKKATQLIFCDLSTPKSDGSFDVYHDIKKKLILHGVPEEEIAFIHDAKNDAQKEALFAKVRSGAVRVLIGSTPRMGAGTNVQKRLIALHHLDVPWRPSDLQQREGRILRQGNENPEVEIYRYVTENTFDAYSYQLVESKQKFISQIFTSRTPVRGAEDTDEVALSYAEVKALAAGNPKIKEKMDLDVQAGKLRLLKGNYATEQYHLERKVRTEIPSQIAQAKEQLRNCRKDIHRLKEHSTPDTFVMEIMNRRFDKRTEAGEYLSKLVALQQVGEPTRIGTFCGFELYLERLSFSKEPRVEIRGASKYGVSLGETDRGNIIRMENVLKVLPEVETRIVEQIKEYKAQLAAAKEGLGKPFPQEAELQRINARLVELNAELDVGGASASAVALDDGDDNAPSQEREPNRQKERQEVR